MRISQPSSVTDDEVLDPHAEIARRGRSPGSTVTTLPASSVVVGALGEPRRLVDLEPDAVAEPVAEVLAVAARRSITPRATGVDLAAARAGGDALEPGELGSRHELVDLAGVLAETAPAATVRVQSEQ